MLVALVRMKPAELAPPGAEARPEAASATRFRYVLGTPELRTPLLLMAVLGTLGFNFQVIIPLLADRTFGGEVSAYSLLMIAMGVGSIVGALTLGAREQASKGADRRRRARLRRRRRCSPPPHRRLPLEMAALGLLGVCSVTFAAGINSGLQLAAAPEMRGRVMALYSIVFLGSTADRRAADRLDRGGDRPAGDARARGRRRARRGARGGCSLWSERDIPSPAVVRVREGLAARRDAFNDAADRIETRRARSSTAVLNAPRRERRGRHERAARESEPTAAD